MVSDAVLVDGSPGVVAVEFGCAGAPAGSEGTALAGRGEGSHPASATVQTVTARHPHTDHDRDRIADRVYCGAISPTNGDVGAGRSGPLRATAGAGGVVEVLRSRPAVDTMIERALSLTMALTLLGCPSSDDATEDTTGAEGSSDGTPTTGPATTGAESTGDEGPSGPEPGPLADGESCPDNLECMSLFCELYTDVLDDKMGVCAPAPTGGNTRMTATVWDFTTRMPVPGAEVIVASAVPASADPTTVMAIMSGTADDQGRVDTTSDIPILAQIGILALVSAPGAYLTGTGLAAPNDDGRYLPGVDNHDIWSVQEADLLAWTLALEGDPEIAAGLLPLGDAGGVVGLVRDAATGEPVAGVTVVSESGGSDAIVRYLMEDDTFGAEATSTTGIYVILDPELAEEFRPMMDGVAVGGSGTAGSAGGAAFTLIMNVNPPA